MNPKPVLTIFYQFNPWKSSIGGIQSVIGNFIKYAPLEFEVRLVGTGESHSELGKWQEREWGGRKLKFMPVILLEEDNVRGRIPTTLKYTRGLMNRDLSSDFMHFHRIEPTLVTRKWIGEKALFIHNDIEQQMKYTTGKKALLWQYFPAAYFALEKQLIQQFDYLYSCNQDATEFYRERYPDLMENIQSVKNPVDLERFSPLNSSDKERKRKELAQQLNQPEQTQFILFAGRLHPQKDPVLLLKTLAVLRDYPVHLLMAGAGELNEEVRAEIERLGLIGRVTLLGAVAPEELVGFYQLSTAFVLTSVYEGLPIVVLEALACGVPVVTTPCGETPRILQPGSGEVSVDRSPEAIATSLQTILNHRDFYSSAICVNTAEPYHASRIILALYDQMIRRYSALR